MPLIPIVLAAGSLALAPPVDLKRQPPARSPLGIAQNDGACGPQIDPQFVRFVPPAPSQGSDGLFRLISAPGPHASGTSPGSHPGDRAGCAHMLFTGFAHRP